MKHNPKTIYLAGPMTGIEHYNFPAFDKARDHLNGLNYRVMSPADLDRAAGFDPERDKFEGKNKRDTVERDVMTIIKDIDVMIVLPGYEKSLGCAAELTLAKWIGIPILSYPDLKPRLVETVFSDHNYE